MIPPVRAAAARGPQRPLTALARISMQRIAPPLAVRWPRVYRV
jgi:hypothetical protein